MEGRAQPPNHASEELTPLLNSGDADKEGHTGGRGLGEGGMLRSIVSYLYI